MLKFLSSLNEQSFVRRKNTIIQFAKSVLSVSHFAVVKSQLAKTNQFNLLIKKFYSFCMLDNNTCACVLVCLNLINHNKQNCSAHCFSRCSIRRLKFLFMKRVLKFPYEFLFRFAEMSHNLLVPFLPLFVGSIFVRLRMREWEFCISLQWVWVLFCMEYLHKMTMMHYCA